MADSRRISRSAARDAPEARGPATSSYEASSAILYVRTNRRSSLRQDQDHTWLDGPKEHGKKWLHCWRCNLPVREDWKRCPALDCSVPLQVTEISMPTEDSDPLVGPGRKAKFTPRSSERRNSAQHRSRRESEPGAGLAQKKRPKDEPRPEKQVLHSVDPVVATTGHEPAEVSGKNWPEIEEFDGPDALAKNSGDGDRHNLRVPSAGTATSAKEKSLRFEETQKRPKPAQKEVPKVQEPGEGVMRVKLNDDDWNSQEAASSKAKGFTITGNTVRTSKYTAATFLPLNLAEQFSRLANVYFLIISILQLFTPLSPTSRYSTAAPLSLMLAANMLRELWEDSQRHKDDTQVNNRLVDVVCKGGKVEARKWKDLRVGDIVCVKQARSPEGAVEEGALGEALGRTGQELPADVIQLCASGDQGGSYIDTCNLDGETNLKIKSSVEATRGAGTAAEVAALGGILEYERPNKRLYTFLGKLEHGHGETAAIDNDVVLLRGAVLRNTKWMYGVVVYAGKQSKLMMNAKKAKLKRSNVERRSNLILAAVLVFLAIMCTVGCVGHAVWSADNRDVWYMPYLAGETAGERAEVWLTYFILLNNYVPISLYITMELAKLGQKILMDNDLEMYYEPTDTPMLARTSNLNEELGQVRYLFSDKTGTLTRNEMEFRKCYVRGTSYGFGTTEIGAAAMARGASSGVGAQQDEEAAKEADARQAQFFFDPAVGFDDVRIRRRLEGGSHPDKALLTDFFRILSVAHTVVPEGDGDGTDPGGVVYQAESPDEGALVNAAKVLGFFFCGKTATSHVVNVFGTKQAFEILNINKFNSTRKRMSVVCRTPEGKIELYCKGADNVMLERVAADKAQKDDVQAALKAYAMEGLRTLVLGKKELSESEWQRWDKVHKAASTALSEREEALMAAAEEIEQEMSIVGVTAIEDKLQQGVPDTIAKLARGGIRLWMLTGDKQETAENIGFACNLLTDEMERSYFTAETRQELSAQVRGALAKHGSEGDGDRLALLVDGKALLVLLAGLEEESGAEERQLMLDFLKFAKSCKAVIACRVSPDQKRQVVTLVRKHTKPQPITLSIGDGANDVPMILEAHVGVGISGNEGMQAVRSADYAIAQFSFLQPLMLVHGRDNYRRISVVVMYSLYKNSFLVTSLFFYGVYTGFTGTALYDSLMLAGFNPGWSFFGIIAYGVLERDVAKATALLHPELYLEGVRELHFNLGVLFKWFLSAMIHTAICFFIPVGIHLGNIVNSTAMDDGMLPFGTGVLQALVIAVNLRLLLETNHVTWWNALLYGIGVFLFIIGSLLHSTWPLSSFFTKVDYEYYDITMVLYRNGVSWLIQIFVVVTLLMPDFIAKYLRRTYRPIPADILRELDKGFGGGMPALNGDQDTAPPVPKKKSRRREV